MNPTMNRLLVKVEVKENEEIKKGAQVMVALVLKTGPDVKFVHVGDRVVFSPFGFDEVEMLNPDGNLEKLVVIGEEMIIAIYEE
jgi:co-chaperonin GroES (HSP10)